MYFLNKISLKFKFPFDFFCADCISYIMKTNMYVPHCRSETQC